ncbi:hypothetical protein HK100_011555 [Physocladia obscura]|uniref:50S ribosomal protein L9, chloroplastic n=1 Tax=Physocladia obscura TaxID=109957 RepID=A0AAD5T138_9FUNG|nr:hypothetical protein HK100_011555 [Physocladia obscura]
MPFRKPDIHVLLYEAIPGLGARGEIVQTSLGLARNYLIPFKLGYYVPRTKGRPIIPATWERKDDLGKDDIRFVLPAFYNPAQFTMQSTAAILGGKPKTSEQIQEASALSQISVLEFKRPLIDPKGKRTFGSVTAEDIAALLRDSHGISVDKADIVITLGKIKEIGDHQVTIKTPTSSQIPMTIKVVGE